MLFLYKIVSRLRSSITKYRGYCREDGRSSTRHRNRFPLRNTNANVTLLASFLSLFLSIFLLFLSLATLSLAFASIPNAVYHILTEVNPNGSRILTLSDERYGMHSDSPILSALISRKSFEIRDSSGSLRLQSRMFFRASDVRDDIRRRSNRSAQVSVVKYITVTRKSRQPSLSFCR